MHIVVKSATKIRLELKVTEIVGVPTIPWLMGIIAMVKPDIAYPNHGVDAVALRCIGVILFLGGIWMLDFLRKVKLEADKKGLRWRLPESANDVDWSQISKIHVQRHSFHGQKKSKVTFLLLTCVDGNAISLPFNLDNQEESSQFQKFISQYVQVIDAEVQTFAH